MKKTLLLLAALVAGASLSAQAPAPAAPAYSITTDFTYTTKYVFRGYELAKGALQPSVKLTSGDFYAGIWSSLPANDGYELEIDYFAGYGIKLSDRWAVDTGLTAYSYPGLSGGDKVTYEGFIGLNGTVGIFTTGTYAYYDFTLKGLTVQETLGYSITVDDKTSVNLAATAGHVSPDVGAGYVYYQLGFTVPYKLTDKATITAGVQWVHHNIDNVKNNHFFGTLGCTYAF